MKNGHLLLTLGCLFGSALGGCASPKSPSPSPALPAWLNERIEASAAHLDPGSAVLEYTIDHKKYYELPVPCCDIMVPLYGADGMLVCHPSGGLAGGGDGKCGNLFKGDVPSRVVWKKPAEKKR